MGNRITGKAFVLGDNVDTDQIIPAEHLVYSTSDEKELKMYGRYALSAVPKEKSGLPSGGISFVNEGEYQSEYQIIIAGKNFGCGSSREHAPLSLNIAGVKAVVAQSYARIFYRNAVDGGFLVPLESETELNSIVKTGDIVEILVNENKIILYGKEGYEIKPLGSVFEIVSAGGLFNYARANNMING